jgi:hypothetical protein
MKQPTVADLRESLTALRAGEDLLLPELPPAAFARINAKRERIEAAVFAAERERDGLLTEALRQRSESRALDLKQQQAYGLVRAARNKAAVDLLDAQAEEYIQLVGDLFPHHTLEILAKTSIAEYGGEGAVTSRKAEWRARWWERRTASGAQPVSPRAGDSATTAVVPEKEPSIADIATALKKGRRKDAVRLRCVMEGCSVKELYMDAFKSRGGSTDAQKIAFYDWRAGKSKAPKWVDPLMRARLLMK